MLQRYVIQFSNFGRAIGREPFSIQEGKKLSSRIDIWEAHDFFYFYRSMINLIKEAGAADEVVKPFGDAGKDSCFKSKMVCPDEKFAFKVQASEKDTERRLK